MSLSGYIFLFSLAAIVLLILRYPFLILRPSLWVTIPFLLQIAGAAAFTGPEIERGYPLAQQLRILTLLFPVGILGWVMMTPGISAVAARIHEQTKPTLQINPQFERYQKMIAFWIGCLSVIILLAYLREVPLMSTGLFRIIEQGDPRMAALAREESLKLLTSPILRYAFTFHQKIFAPLLVVLLVLWRIPRFSIYNLLRIALVVVVIFSVMLPGARATAGRLILVLAITVLLRKGLMKGFMTLTMAILAALVFAAIMTLMRQSMFDYFSIDVLIHYFQGPIFYRAFITSFETGILTNLYAHTHGLLGISAIRPLAFLLGVPYVPLANEVALSYSPTAFFSGLANTCFLFDYQAAFGLGVGWFVSLIALCSLDFLLFAYRRLHGVLLVAFFAALMNSLIELVSIAYTTSLLTSGILPISLLALIIGRYASRAARKMRAE